MRPIRTVGEVELEFAVFTREAFGFQRIAGEAGRLRRLGMSLRAIASALEVDEKTVRKALRNAPHAERQGTASGRHASCTAGSSGRPAHKSHAGRRRHLPRKQRASPAQPPLRTIHAHPRSHRRESPSSTAAARRRPRQPRTAPRPRQFGILRARSPSARPPQSSLAPSRSRLAHCTSQARN